MNLTQDTLIGKKLTLVAYSNEIQIHHNIEGWDDVGNCTFLKVKLDDELVIIKIIESRNDGWSSLAGFLIVDETDKDYKTVSFNKLKPAKVTFMHYPNKNDDSDGWNKTQDSYEFIDGAGNIWFKFGTDNSDDYYPSYFCYAPEVDLKKHREFVIGDILDE